MALKINIEKKEKGVFMVTLDGSLDSDTYMDLENEIQPILEQSPKVMMFDMKDVEYISSMGIGVILTTQKAVKKAGGSIIMINMQPQIKKVFEIVEALPSFNIFESIDEADDYLYRLQQQEMEKRRLE